MVYSGKDKRLKATYDKVRKRYNEIREENPHFSENAIHTIIAKEMDYTPAGIRRILIKTKD